MAKRKTKAGASSGSGDRQVAAALGRIADCLGVLALGMEPMKDLEPREKMKALYIMGFSRKQIAALVGTTQNTVSVRLSEMGLTAR